jgi:hypothetical protein
MRLPLALLNRTVPAGGITVINVTGSLVRMKECKRVVYVTLDDGPKFPMEAGIGVQMQEIFTKVILSNENDEDVDVEIWIGHENVIDNRLNTRFDRDNPVFTKDARCVTLGSKNTLTPGQSINLPARDIGVHRKQLIVSNLGTAVLTIQSPDLGVDVGIVLANSQFTVFSSDWLVVHNPSGVATNTVYIMEVVYE